MDSDFPDLGLSEIRRKGRRHATAPVNNNTKIPILHAGLGYIKPQRPAVWTFWTWDQALEVSCGEAKTNAVTFLVSHNIKPNGTQLTDPTPLAQNTQLRRPGKESYRCCQPLHCSHSNLGVVTRVRVNAGLHWHQGLRPPGMTGPPRRDPISWNPLLHRSDLREARNRGGVGRLDAQPPRPDPRSWHFSRG